LSFTKQRPFFFLFDAICLYYIPYILFLSTPFSKLFQQKIFIKNKKHFALLQVPELLKDTHYA